MPSGSGGAFRRPLRAREVDENAGTGWPSLTNGFCGGARWTAPLPGSGMTT